MVRSEGVRVVELRSCHWYCCWSFGIIVGNWGRYFEAKAVSERVFTGERREWMVCFGVGFVRFGRGLGVALAALRLREMGRLGEIWGYGRVIFLL